MKALCDQVARVVCHAIDFNGVQNRNVLQHYRIKCHVAIPVSHVHILDMIPFSFPCCADHDMPVWRQKYGHNKNTRWNPANADVHHMGTHAPTVVESRGLLGHQG